MTPISDESPLSRLLLDVAIQDRFMRPWRTDQDFIADGGNILYAIDADVVRFYANPEANAIKKGKRIGYGQVFSNDPEEVSGAIARRLADYIFFELSENLPLLIIPPIESEINAILVALIAQFGNQAPKQVVDVAAIEALIARYEAEGFGTCQPEVIKEILGKALELTYLESGPSADFRRLVRLLEMKRVAAPEVLLSHPLYRDTAVARVLAPFQDIRRVFEHDVLRRQWMSHLKPAASAADDKRRHSTERDASALARLQLWNRLLEEEGVRIVYITGARHVIEAARHMKTEPGGPSVAELYIRHPRAFLSAPEVLKAEDEITSAHLIEEHVPSSFARWLETFLGSFGAQREILDPHDPFSLGQHGKEVAVTAHNKQPALEQERTKRWLAYSENVRISYQPPSKVHTHLEEELAHVVGANAALRSWDEVRRQLDERISELTSESWEACFRVATEAGYTIAFLDKPRVKDPCRAVPPLSFDSWAKTYNFINTISRWHKQKDFDTEFYNNGIFELQHEDPSGYAYYIAHAALFAGRNLWSVAATLAGRAIARAEANKEVSANANGREGYYLMAFCRRHAARSAQELNSLETLVEKAEQIYHKETDTRAPNFDAVPERFAAERLALQTTRWMFDRFDSSPAGQAVTTSEQMVATASNLIEKYNNLADRIDHRIEKTENLRIKAILYQVRFRIALNVLTLWISSSTSENLATSLQHYTFLYAHFNNKNAYRENVDISYFAKAVFNTAEQIITLSGKMPPEMTRKLTVFDYERCGLYAVFPYDKARYGLMRDLVRNVRRTAT